MKNNNKHPKTNTVFFKKIFAHIFTLGKILEAKYKNSSYDNGNEKLVDNNFKEFYKFECIETYSRLIYYIYYTTLF